MKRTMKIGALLAAVLLMNGGCAAEKIPPKLSEVGFYLDTDVEILQKDIFDKYRQYQNVFAFETERRINTGLFYGCEKFCAVRRKSAISPAAHLM